MNDHDRFWSRVQKVDGDACWEWPGSLTRHGYGRVLRSLGDKKHSAAHRVAYETAVGPIPIGLCVCHRCDNRRCVRPDHLFLGTIADNNTDKTLKGRCPRGEDHGNAKLTEEQVVEILAALSGGARGSDLARKFGVSEPAISMIRNGLRWPHLTAMRKAG